MSGRIRSIKPEVAKNADLWDLGIETGLPVYQAYTMLWCYADREGRFKWRPRELKTDILPYFDGDCGAVLDALASRGFIVRYTVDGVDYGWIPTFGLHQLVNHREAMSKLPAPPSRVCPGTPGSAPHDEEHTETTVQGTPGSASGEGVGKGRGREGLGNGLGISDVGTRQEPEGIQARCQRIIANPHRALDLEPHRWPEVVEPIEALAAADGRAKPRIGHYAGDKGVQVLVGHYAAGWTQAELVAIYRGIPASTWWLELRASGKRPGASWLSSEVVRRHGEGLGPKDAQEAAQELARRKVQNEKLAGVARLNAEVEYTESLLTQHDDGWEPEILPPVRHVARLPK